MRRYKCLSFVALFALSLTALSIGFSDNVNAASAYDNIYQSTNQVFIGHSNLSGRSNCERYDIANQVGGIISNRDNWYNKDHYDVLWPIYQEAVSTGSVSVSQYLWRANNTPSSAEVWSVPVTFRTDTGSPLDWALNAFVRPQQGYFLSIDTAAGGLGANNCNPKVYTQNANANNFSNLSTPRSWETIAGNSGEWYRNLFARGYDPNYPAGYEGETIPQTWNPPSQLSEIEFQYEIDSDGSTRLKYLGNYEFPLNCDGRYTAQKYFNSNWDGNDYENTFEVVDGPMETFTATGELTGAGYYVFIVQADEESACNPPPDTFMAAGVIRVYWDGFNAIQGNNVGGCDIDFCSNLSSQQSKINKIMNSLTVDMFGLQQAIFAPVQFLSSAATAPCTTLVLPIPKMGNMDIPCMTPIYNQYQPQLISIWQSIITGLVSYYVVINIIARIKKTSDPKDDSIEVAQL